MPCYGRGETGDALRQRREVVRWWRLVAGGARDFRCVPCRRYMRLFALEAPPETCPRCGCDVAEAWNEVTEG